jgi:prepilin-type N-terminal cleavage/methylation domain-containing protein
MLIKNTQKSGFTLVEIMIVVAIIGLLAAIAIPNFVRARAKAQTNACIANLKQLDGAIEVWATENKKKTGDAVTMGDLCTAYVKSTPACPASGAYTTTTVGAAPAIACPNVATLTEHKLP